MERRGESTLEAGQLGLNPNSSTYQLLILSNLFRLPERHSPHL